jgi:hypothetical protein
MYSDDMGWNGSPTANVWHHLVVTYDGTTVLLYADGVLKNSAPRTAATPVGPIWVGSQTADGVTPSVGWFSGYLNTIRIHTGALSSSAVAANYALGPVTLPPATPVGLAGTAGNGQISLAWGTVSGATDYNLWRSTNNGGTYQSIAIGVNTVSYVDTNAVSGQTNYYKVAAMNNYGASASSAAVGVFLALPALNIASPDGVTLSVSWPAWANDWSLYYATNLTPPAAWLPVTNSAASTNSQFTVTLPISSGTSFFRLAAP